MTCVLHLVAGSWLWWSEEHSIRQRVDRRNESRCWEDKVHFLIHIMRMFTFCIVLFSWNIAYRCGCLYNREFHARGVTYACRVGVDDEISNQQLYFPGLLPKLPGRLYYLFGKPIETRGMDILKHRKNANVLYLQIKSEIERIISYLKRKREEDPYRNIIQRTLYQASWGYSAEVPTFDPW